MQGKECGMTSSNNAPIQQLFIHTQHSNMSQLAATIQCVLEHNTYRPWYLHSIIN